MIFVEKLRLAEQTGSSEEDLEKLSYDESWIVRLHVANNPSTPSAVLEKLSKDEDWLVRRQVAENLNTPTFVLERLVEDDSEDYSIVSKVARNTNTSISVLETLSVNDDSCIRSAAIQNPQNFRIREILKVRLKTILRIGHVGIPALDMEWLYDWEKDVFDIYRR